MELGCFSVSLNVSDIAKSRAFYEALGFTVFRDMTDQGWCMMKNGQTNIGLFKGHISANTLTFNPGWDQDARETASFTDVRDIQQRLDAAGVTVADRAADGEGPAHIVLLDPDDNAILIDQHRC